MGDQGWALLVGVITVVILRIVDWYLPKDYMSKWATEHGVKRRKSDEEDEDNNDEDDGR